MGEELVRKALDSRAWKPTLSIEEPGDYRKRCAMKKYLIFLKYNHNRHDINEIILLTTELIVSLSKKLFFISQCIQHVINNYYFQLILTITTLIITL